MKLGIIAQFFRMYQLLSRTVSNPRGASQGLIGCARFFKEILRQAQDNAFGTFYVR